MLMVKQAAVLCGGLGNRLRPLTDNLPKPMVPLNGVPFLQYLLEQLRENGIVEVVLMTGYLGEMISDHFGDGSALGIRLRYSHGPAEWDTGRRLWEAKDLLEEKFLLLYGDNFLPFELKKSVKFHETHGKLLSFLVTPKAKANIRLAPDGTVEVYDKTRTAPGLDHVELGYMIVDKKVFDLYTTTDISFSDIIFALVAKRQVAGRLVREAYYSVSDMERLKLAEEYLRPKKILLIDRDGVINAKAGRGNYLASWEEFRFIPETLEGMKQLSLQGYTFIVISNQAGIARGYMTAETVVDIHARMIDALAREGVTVHEVYMCPHHWDEKCFCRKPQPGMFFAASRKWLFRLDKTCFIGDDPRDCQAAYNAGCRSVFIGPETELKDLKEEERPHLVVRALTEAVAYLEKI